ncbi:hypothetical protein EVAR_69354_1 [Eumeta japonica]|uniref:Uncharacterized protein n=1 Tax=Eumeta variegata TaxID=151549 RepID=A0A4C2A0L0_EUMVA|nr:hypothetical protein EVAR_69354_1 [Eumeta japonica]
MSGEEGYVVLVLNERPNFQAGYHLRTLTLRTPSAPPQRAGRRLSIRNEKSLWEGMLVGRLNQIQQTTCKMTKTTFSLFALHSRYTVVEGRTNFAAPGLDTNSAGDETAPIRRDDDLNRARDRSRGARAGRRPRAGLFPLKFGWCHAADTNSVAERRRRLPLRENICKREAPRLTESRTTKELKWAPPPHQRHGAAFYTPPPFVIRRRECPGSRCDEPIKGTTSARLHDLRLYYYCLIFVATSGLNSDTCAYDRTFFVKKLVPSVKG